MDCQTFQVHHFESQGIDRLVSLPSSDASGCLNNKRDANQVTGKQTKMASIGFHAGSDSNDKEEMPHVVRPKITEIRAFGKSCLCKVI
jgi:hypothetical protein